MVKSYQDACSIIQSNKLAFQKLGVKRLGIFGSFVVGEQTPDSDIDLLAEFAEDKKTFRNFMGVVDQAEKLLGRSVDLVTPESLSPHIGPYIKQSVRYVQIT